MITTFLSLLACSPGFETYPVQLVTQDAILQVPPGTPSESLNPDLTFCSPLSFNGVAWNQALTLNARRALGIGLSISGSFEGSDGWENISNDFDGQGLSAGLLNQTLGTGSLQPLLAEMENGSPKEFNSSFSSAHLKSFASMLNTWKIATSWRPKSLELSMMEVTDRDAFVSEFASESDLELMATTPAAQSAVWARKTLYSFNGSFISSWKSEIQTLLRKPPYVSLQVEAARRYHTKALEYLQRVGIHDLRAYLLMFDIVVQNGSISDAHFTQWDKKVKAQKLTTVVSKLKALVDIRVLDSKPAWQADVKSRKYTIIDGVGTVHGRKLNLPKSYCYSPTDPL
jgi:hypothetical protein